MMKTRNDGCVDDEGERGVAKFDGKKAKVKGDSIVA
jgi:hypothetical protein